MSTITSRSGNLLKSDDVDVLVNTVNCIGPMGKGIALAFKNAFPENYKAFRIACKKGWVRPGRIHVHELPPALCGAKYIFNFPTKRDWKDGSLMEDIEAGLVDLIRLCGKLKIKSIALPPLGCGNGGLDWREVRPKIVAALSDLPNLRVVLYDPPGFFEKTATAPVKVPVTLVRARSAGRDGFVAPF